MNSPLKSERTKRELSLAQVALAVDTTTGTLSRIENGLQTARPALAERLAQYFGYAITEIQILYPERFTSR